MEHRLCRQFIQKQRELICDFRCVPGHIFYSPNSPHKTQFYVSDSKNLESLKVFELQSLKTIITKTV